MNRFFFALFFIGLLPLSTPALAQGTTAPHIFAFPGTACPPVSRPYEGPENDVAIKKGVIYCVFARTATRVPKADSGGQCPPDMKLAKEDADYFWCALPQDAIFNVRNTVNLGLPKGPQMQDAGPLVMMPSAAAPSPAPPVTVAPPETPEQRPSLMDRFRAWLAKLFR